MSHERRGKAPVGSLAVFPRAAGFWEIFLHPGLPAAPRVLTVYTRYPG